MVVLSEIASMIEAGFARMPRRIRQELGTMARLGTIGDELSYQLVADVRRGLHGWRGTQAREVKAHLETHLTLYRVRQWDGPLATTQPRQVAREYGSHPSAR